MLSVSPFLSKAAAPPCPCCLSHADNSAPCPCDGGSAKAG